MRLPDGWQEANNLIIPDRKTIVIAGREKQGKTNFALTAPDPIAHFNLDVGLEGVIEKFRKDKVIYTHDYPYRTEMGASTMAIAQPIWEKFKADYKFFLNSKEIRTIVWDTESEAFDLLRYARLGTLALPRDVSYKYGPVNAEFREMIRTAFASDKNLIIIKKMKDEYIKDVRTGGDEPAGFKDMSYLVQVNLIDYRDGLDGPFHIQVENCRQNPDVAGMDLEGDECNFDYLNAIIG